RVFVTATMPICPGSRPVARAAAVIPARTTASRSRTAASSESAFKQPRLFQYPPDLDQGKTDHVGQRAIDALDERGPSTLDRIAPRLALGLSAGDVSRDRIRGEGAKPDPRDDDL